MPTVDLGDGKSVTFGAKTAEGDLCDLFAGIYKDPTPTAATPVHTGPKTRFDHILEDDDGIEVPVMVKVCNDRSNIDLVEREVVVLKRLPATNPNQSTFNQYYPTSYASYRTHDDRPAHVMSLISDSFSFVDILRAFPQGIDYRDMAWMFKRTLVGLWWAHQNGILHGAILPPHVLLNGQNHGAKIIDWCYSVPTRNYAHLSLAIPRRSRPVGEPDPTDSIIPNRISAFVTEYADYYPPEVFERKEAGEGTDIYMAVKCMIAILGGDVKTNEMPDTVPVEIRSLFDLCLNPQRTMRPSKADDLHEAFDNLMKELVGKPAFRKFAIP
jgi:serine/threonine protein kinase